MREQYRVMIFHDFYVRLNQKEYNNCIYLTYGNEAPSHNTVFRYFSEFQSV